MYAGNSYSHIGTDCFYSSPALGLRQILPGRRRTRFDFGFAGELDSATKQNSAVHGVGTFGDSSSRDISSSVNWKSSSAKIAVVDSSGRATAYATGTTTVTASQGDISGSTSLAVSINGTGLTISPSSQTISDGQTVQFTATLNGSSVSEVTWSSSRTTIATIDQDGVATGLAIGTTTITATATVSGTQYHGTGH